MAAWSEANERNLAPTTAAMALRLGRVCRFAVRRGWLGEDPVAGLERGEKPRWEPRTVAILNGPELGRFLAESRSYRPLFELLAFTGLRIGEALGLYWEEVDLDKGRLRVARQLTPQRTVKEPKTSAGVRDVVLAPVVVRLLHEMQGGGDRGGIRLSGLSPIAAWTIGRLLLRSIGRSRHAPVWKWRDGSRRTRYGTGMRRC